MEVELRMGMRSNVLLCRAIARIGEVPQAEGFGSGLWLRVSVVGACRFCQPCGKSLRVRRSTPSTRKLATSPIAAGAATQGKTLPVAVYDWIENCA